MKLATVALTVITIALAVPTGILLGQSSPVRGQMVLDVGTQAWEAALVWRPTVVYNGSSFTMWYTGEDSSSLGVDNIGVATSTDGINWARYEGNPVLKLGLLGTWDSCSDNQPWVIREGSGYKMWFEGQKCAQARLAQEAIGYATSPDGINWTKYPGNPVLTPGASGSFDDEYVSLPVVISSGSGYTMYYRGFTSGSLSRMGIATSTDGIHWTKKGIVSIPKAQWDSAYNRLGGIVKVGDVFVASYDGYSSAPGPNYYNQIGLATSTDGLTWTQYSGNPVIIHGAVGWDAGGIFQTFILTVGSNYYVYYTAWNNMTASASRDRIGLAILPASQYTIPEYPSVPFMMITATLTTMLFVVLKRRRNQARSL